MKRFLSEENGRWRYGKFIFVKEDICKKLLLLNAQEEYQTRENKEHLVLVSLYNESLNNIR